MNIYSIIIIVLLFLINYAGLKLVITGCLFGFSIYKKDILLEVITPQEPNMIETLIIPNNLHNDTVNLYNNDTVNLYNNDTVNLSDDDTVNLSDDDNVKQKDINTIAKDKKYNIEIISNNETDIEE